MIPPDGGHKDCHSDDCPEQDVDELVSHGSLSLKRLIRSRRLWRSFEVHSVFGTKIVSRKMTYSSGFRSWNT